MSAYGYHWTPCRGGGGGFLVIGAVLIAAEVILNALWWLIAVTVIAAALSVAAVVLLSRATARNEAEVGAMLEATRPARLAAATGKPQVTAASVPVIIHHHHYHAVPGPEPAEAVRAVIPGRVIASVPRNPPGASMKEEPHVATAPDS